VAANSVASLQGLGARRLRGVLGSFTTGVVIVTTVGDSGRPIGLTVNSFNSVSIDPPLILWSLATGANSARAFRDCERFRVQVLNAGQLDVARQCATRGADKFAHGEWHDGRHGLPSLDGCVAWFECENHRQYDEGDHVIIVGRVTAFGGAGGTPLIFHAGRYVTDLAESPLPRELRAGPR
jgi:flavin reductase (DIM6/NTAB) family NADH-FMN oxidoreductase RutF